jgi:hypothetical protein
VPATLTISQATLLSYSHTPNETLSYYETIMISSVTNDNEKAIILQISKCNVHRWLNTGFFLSQVPFEDVSKVLCVPL